MSENGRSALLYWVFKWLAVAPLTKLLFRPWITGEDNIPATGPAILVGNHVSAGDTWLLPVMIKRRLTFPAKVELFNGRSVGGRIFGAWLRSVGQLPMDRTGGRASASSMDGVLSVLASGQLLGIFPEGTRSPDGRMYKGKTGVARLVLAAGVPVIPVGMIDTQFRRSRFLRIPLMHRPGVRIGTPLDFRRYAAAGNDRAVLRWVTDEIMYAVMQLSGQTYVDAYASSVKAALAEGRDLAMPVLSRPGEGLPVPPVPPVSPGPPVPAGDVTA